MVISQSWYLTFVLFFLALVLGCQDVGLSSFERIESDRNESDGTESDDAESEGGNSGVTIEVAIPLGGVVEGSTLVRATLPDHSISDVQAVPDLGPTTFAFSGDEVPFDEALNVYLYRDEQQQSCCETSSTPAWSGFAYPSTGTSEEKPFFELDTEENNEFKDVACADIATLCPG